MLTSLIGDVYDITQYLSFHPGGRNELMKAAGIDCTSLFTQVALAVSKSVPTVIYLGYVHTRS